MTLEEVGNAGLIFAGLGVVAFAILFLTCVRWWTDTLGRSIAAVAAVPAIILGLGVYRVMGGDLPGGTQVWRATLYPLLGVVSWIAGGVFIWAQFFAPRVKKIKKNRTKEEIDA